MPGASAWHCAGAQYQAAGHRKLRPCRRLAVNGVALGDVRVSVSGGRDGPAPYAFTGISIVAHPGGGSVTVADGSVRPFGDAFEAAANVTLDDLQVAAVLGAAAGLRDLGGRAAARQSPPAQ